MNEDIERRRRVHELAIESGRSYANKCSERPYFWSPELKQRAEEEWVRLSLGTEFDQFKEYFVLGFKTEASG